MLIMILRFKVLGTFSPRAPLPINDPTGQKRDRMESLTEHDLGRHYKAHLHFRSGHYQDSTCTPEIQVT